jgi:hypothetical protein
MNKYIEIIKLLERIFGKSAVSKSLGTRTNVVRLPGGKQGLDPTTRHFDVEGTAQKNPELVNTIKNSVEDRMGDITRMNDQELLTYKQNLQRLADHVDPPALPSADIISAGSKQRVTGEGIEALKQTSGQTNPPGTIVGNIESRINKLKQIGQEMEKTTGEKVTLTDVLKDFETAQSSMSRMQDEGLVRATARQILINDIKAGKIKNITVSEAINMKEPIDPFRQIYGEGALEQLDSLIPDLRSLKTETEAEKLARSKFKFEPDEARLPGSVSIEEGRKAEQEFGISSKIEEEIKPEGIIIPFKKKITEPENKADGGSIGLDYLMGIDNRPKYASGGNVKKILDLIAKANKELKGKKSIEGVNPKTGEVTSPKQPIMTADDLKTKHKDAFNAHDQIRVDIGDKIAPDMIAESMAEMKGKDYFSLSQREQLDYYKKALAYVDDVRMTKRQNKPIEGGFSFNDPEIKAQMEEAMTVAKKRGDEMRAMGLDPAKSKDYDQYIEIKTKSGDKDFNKYFDDLEIKTKFKGVISDDLLNQILIDDNPQRKAEVIATIEQGLTMQEKGMSPEEIVNVLKNTTRTKQADGGPIGLNYLLGL